jgi:hypothetical protein
MNFNTNKRPSVFLEDINGTWVVSTPNGLARNSEGIVMTFTSDTLDEGKKLVKVLRRM